jgi:Na+/melibiose symporter-like transporter
VTVAADRPDAGGGSLWRHRDFLRLWIAQAISAYGSRITRTALPIIAVKTLGEPEAVVGLLAALQFAPGVLLAVFAGGIVDRSRKRRLLIAADLLRGALVASLTVAWALGALSIVHVVLVGAGVGAASALFQITDVAFLPALVAPGQLAEGNARLEATEGIAEITGPASAGALIAALGAPVAVAIDAASYLWSAAWLGRIRAIEPTVAAAPRGQRRSEDLRVGLRAVFGHPQVRPLVIGHMVWAISGGFFMSLYTLFLIRELGLSEALFGVIVACGGVGALGGAVVSRGLVRWLGLGPALLVASTLSLSCALFIPLAAGPTAVVIGCLIAHQVLSDGFSVAYTVQAVTLRQTVLPLAVLGRANAAIYVCTAGMAPLAALAAGAIAQVAGIRAAVWVGVLIGLAVPPLLWPLRRLREMPAAAAAVEDRGDG